LIRKAVNAVASDNNLAIRRIETEDGEASRAGGTIVAVIVRRERSLSQLGYAFSYQLSSNMEQANL
jgi:hypothetical protein